MAIIVLNHDKLRGRIIEKFGSNAKFAEHLEISIASLSSKLNGKTDFTASEIYKSCILLDIKNEEVFDYFFTLKTELNSANKMPLNTI